MRSHLLEIFCIYFHVIFPDKILFGFSCEIEMGRWKCGLNRAKNRVFHRNIMCYARNFMSYERNYICYCAN